MTFTHKKSEMTLRDDQPSHQEVRVSGEGTAQSQENEDNKPTSPGFKSNTAIHSVSNFVVNGGSIMNGTVENIGDKSRQLPKQKNRTPIVVESGSLDQDVCTVGSIQKGAKDPASFRQLNHLKISRGAKFVNQDLNADEFLEYFCGRKT